MLGRRRRSRCPRLPASGQRIATTTSSLSPKSFLWRKYKGIVSGTRWSAISAGKRKVKAVGSWMNVHHTFGSFFTLLLHLFYQVHYCTNAHGHEVEFMFVLNPQSGIPIYRQLLEQVRRLIASGQLQPGTELPSIRDLAVKHAVNPMTVSKAYGMLEAEGLLERNRGKPMTIAKHRRGQTQLSSRMQQLHPHLNHVVLAARQLELSEGEVV